MSNRSNFPGQEKRKFLDIIEATSIKRDIFTMIDLFEGSGRIAVLGPTGSGPTYVSIPYTTIEPLERVKLRFKPSVYRCP